MIGMGNLSFMVSLLKTKNYGHMHQVPYFFSTMTIGEEYVEKYLIDSEWQIFNRQRMLVIDGKYNSEDGMSTGSL